MSHYLLGADIGGTGIKINIFDLHAQRLLLIESLRTLTEADAGPEQASWKLAKLAREAAKSANIGLKEITAIGVATPGPCDYQAGVYLSSPNLESWSGFEMKASIEKILGLPAYFLNDASAATLAEKQLGVGSDKTSLVLFTVGTGIGGGYADSNGLFSGNGYFSTYATELGHTLIADPYDSTTRVCSCGTKGHLEGYASFSAMLSRVEEMIAKSPTLVERNSWDKAQDKGEFLIAHANKGDKFFQDICCEAASYLAAGVLNAVNTFAPEIVAIGGGASKLEEFYLKTLIATYKGLVPGTWVLQREVPIVNALLGNDAGIIGAALYANSSNSC